MEYRARVSDALYIQLGAYRYLGSNTLVKMPLDH